MGLSKKSPQLAGVQRFGALAWRWLGVRDDFRNWVIRAA